MKINGDANWIKEWKKQRVNKFQAAMDSDEEGVEKLGADSMK